MAIYGIGAYYECDITKDFIEQKCACIGYVKPETSSLYEMYKHVKIGDIIYIKSYSKGKLFIKAIGYVTGRTIKERYFPNSDKSMGYGRDIMWKCDFSQRQDWIEIQITSEENKNNVYNNTLYEEYSSRIIKKIIKLIY